MRKSQRRKKYEKLDGLVREIVLIRDNWTCQKSGKKITNPRDAHISHVYPKSHYGWLRFDLDNVKLLSMREHLYWWHKEPIEASKWFQNKFPDRAKRLAEKSVVRNKLSLLDLDNIEKELNLKLEEMKELEDMVL